MFKIWARVQKGDKILKSVMYTCEENFTPDNFFKYVTEICEKLDMPVPIILQSHIQHFIQFNLSRFAPSDFIDQVDFGRFILESVPLEKQAAPALPARN